MKKLLVVVSVAAVAAIAGNVYQALPNAKPSKPIYVQRVEQLLNATNAGQWKQACDAAPTAAYSYDDFISMAIGYGATKLSDLPTLCEKVFQVSLTQADGKTPIGLTWKIVYWSEDDGKATPSTDKLVIVQIKWDGPGEKVRTITFHASLARIPWEGGKAKCKGKPCPELRWYVLGAD